MQYVRIVLLSNSNTNGQDAMQGLTTGTIQRGFTAAPTGLLTPVATMT